MKHDISKALSAYINQCFTAEEKARAIAEFAANHGEVGPEKINWGHVGSMVHVNNLLDEIMSFIGIAEE